MLRVFGFLQNKAVPGFLAFAVVLWLSFVLGALLSLQILNFDLERNPFPLPLRTQSVQPSLTLVNLGSAAQPATVGGEWVFMLLFGVFMGGVGVFRIFFLNRGCGCMVLFCLCFIVIFGWRGTSVIL